MKNLPRNILIVFAPLGLALLAYNIYNWNKLPDTFDKIPPRELLPPLEDLFQKEKLVFGSKVNPGFIGESHAGGSGSGGSDGGGFRYVVPNCFENGIATAYYFVTLPTHIVNSALEESNEKEKTFDVEFILFENGERVTNPNTTVIVKGAEGHDTFSENTVKIKPRDFLPSTRRNSHDEILSYVDFEVQVNINDPLNSEHHLVMDISDHHSFEKFEVKSVTIRNIGSETEGIATANNMQNNRIEVLVPERYMYSLYCPTSQTELEMYQCKDTLFHLHISEHIVIQELCNKFNLPFK